MSSQSVSTRMAPSRLFDQTREMEIECEGETRSTPNKSLMKLKIYERSLDNMEREIRVELTSLTDDDFVYAGGVTKTTFPGLLKRFLLNVDFENFAKALIEQISPKDILINVNLLNSRSTCSIQIHRPTDLQRTTLPLEMRAVKGEELLSYLKGALRAQREANSKHQRAQAEAGEKIAVLEKEVTRNGKLEEENIRLREYLEEAKREADDNKIDMTTWKQKYEAAEVENEDLKAELNEMLEIEKEAYDREDEAKMRIEEMADEIDQLKSQLDEVTEDRRVADSKLRDAKEQIAALRRELNKNDAAKMLKLVRDESGVASCDERKLRELEADLKEKNELIAQMTVKIAELAKENEQLTASRNQLEESNTNLQVNMDKAQRLLEVYRRSSPSTSHAAPSFTSPHYSPSPLAYSTPPTALNPTTPSIARVPGLGRLDLNERLPLTPFNRPLTQLNGGALKGSTQAEVSSSPRVLSYSARINNDKKN